jgi:hypothetical protein
MLSPKQLWSKYGLIALFPFAFTGMTMGLLPIRCWDYWWHVALGALLDATGQFPDKVYYLYTMDPKGPSYVQPWLSQWLFFQSQQHFGEVGVLVWRNLASAFASGVGGVVAWRRSGSAILGATLAILGSTFAGGFVEARSHLGAWPLFFPALGLAYAARAHGWSMRWPMIGLPLLAALWANLHGTFMIPGLIAFAASAAALLDRWRAPQRFSPRTTALWATTAALAFLAAGVNPMGLRIYAYMAMMGTNEVLLRTVSDFFPTTLSFPDSLGPAFYTVLTMILVLAWRKRRELDLFDLFLLAGFAVLSIRQCRELMWFGFLLPIAASPLLHGLTRDEDTAQPANTLPYKLAAAALLIAPLLTQPWWPFMRPVMASLDLEDKPRSSSPFMGTILRATPVEAADLLAQSKLQDLRIYNDQYYSGYLMYRLQDPTNPQPLVFTDHRYELPPSTLWDEYYAIGSAKGWREAFAKYKINAVIASTAAQNALIQALRADPAWREALKNDDHSLFLPAQ